MTNIEGRPVVIRESVHPSISTVQISDLVEQFYDRVANDPRLAPIFAKHMSQDWDTHLEKMKAFWRSVLLRTGEYKGKPVPAHLKIDGIEVTDFQLWLRLFVETANEIFAPEVAGLVESAALRIATSLWLSRARDPFALPLEWPPAKQPSPTNRLNGELT